MNTLNYVFYGSIIALLLLQGMMTSLKVQEPFVITTKNVKGKQNEKANLNCSIGEKIIDVDLIKYGSQPYIDGKISIGGISNIDLKDKTKCVNKESCSFIVDNKLAGKDPAPGTPKLWQIAYKCEKPDVVTPPPVTTEPVRPPPVTTQPIAPPPIITEPVRSQPIEPPPVTTQPVKPEPVRPEPVKLEPVRPESITPEPVRPQPITIQPIAPPPVTTQPIAPMPVIRLPSFMDQSRLLEPFTDNELFEYKVFHIIIISCVIKQAVNEKIYKKNISFTQIYRGTLQSMGIEPRIFTRNLDAYMTAILKQLDRTWREVFDSKLFLDAVTENINYFIQNPSQSKLNEKDQPIGTFEHIRKPILDETVFVKYFEKCRLRIKSLEFYSPIAFNRRLYD